MVLKDIVALANAGFTSEQILAFVKTENPVQAPLQTPTQTPAPAQVQTPTQTTAPTQNPDYVALMGKLDGLTQALQATSILSSQQPAERSVDDILASIINPPNMGENGGTK